MTTHSRPQVPGAASHKEKRLRHWSWAPLCPPQTRRLVLLGSEESWVGVGVGQALSWNFSHHGNCWVTKMGQGRGKNIWGWDKN